MSSRWTSLVVVLALALSTSPACAAEAGRDEAVAAARGWLALVDAGKFDESWEQSGAVFRRAVTKEQWRQSLGAARTPLGALKTRELDNATYATALPGAPDGRYFVLQFDAAFQNKAAAVETVTASLEADGKWRIVGYYIR